MMTEVGIDNTYQEVEGNGQSEPEEVTSEFSHLYKYRGRDAELSQQERRDILLKEQKEKRHSIVDAQRDFSEIFFEDESDMFEASEASSQLLSEEMDVHIEKQRRHRNKFVLMHSEWFTEVPVDLEENWLVKLAPEGFRVLVIAKKCHTVVLNERGKVLTLKTNLPGGGPNTGHGLTVLDCIYHKASKTIFVLDCLYWNTMSMLDSETTFRFYWLKNQFSENSKFLETNKAYKFHVLEFFPAEKSLIQEKIFEKVVVSGNLILYNGVVFYHKELQYAFKQTPLLGWLYSYMLPEKLGVDVPQELMNKMPKDYEHLEKYLETLEEKHERKKKNYFRDRRHQKNRMDTS